MTTLDAKSATLILCIALCAIQISTVSAQQAAAKPAPESARQAAPIDLTGTWVAIVNEDWRWRMLTPGKGDYTSVPLNSAGRRTTQEWDSSQDGSCKAYGAAGLMRMPIRVRITWESEDVLKIESDRGQQTRRLYFADAPPVESKTLQGRSMAVWERPPSPGDGFGFGTVGPRPPGGSLKVSTTDLQPGWLRRNGIPYGENARVTEHYDRFSAPDATEWFVVTTIVEDPQYLARPYVTSSHFRREASPSKWNLRPCKD